MHTYLDASRERLCEHFIANYATTLTSSAAVAAAPTTNTLAGLPQKVNFLACYKKRSPVSKDELEEFFQLPLEDFENCDPIHWWAGRCLQFPDLSRFARNILSIPGMCVSLARFIGWYSN